MSSRRDAVRRKQLPHPRTSVRGVAKQSSPIGKPESLREMQDVSRALLSTHHDEVILMPIEPCKEHDTGLVEARGRAKDVS